MNRISHLGRLAAAAVLVASGATVALTAPASAADIPWSFNCMVEQDLNVANSDTVTITIASPCSGLVLLTLPGGGPVGTATLNGSPMTAGTPAQFAVGDTVVFTVPASGDNTNSLRFLESQVSQDGPEIRITFPQPTPRNDSLVDNGNGSMTVTFDPVTGPQSVFINIFPSGTTCSSIGVPTGRLYVLGSSSNFPSPMTSPTTISAGSMAYTYTGRTATPTTISAGSYQACFDYSITNSPTTLVQSLAITLGEVPTSTTTTGSEPVVPAFTG